MMDRMVAACASPVSFVIGCAMVHTYLNVLLACVRVFFCVFVFFASLDARSVKRAYIQGVMCTHEYIPPGKRFVPRTK